MAGRDQYICGVKMRPMCMIIGYLHLVSSIADICCHLVTVAIVTNGFQCDVDSEKLRTVTNQPMLELLLLVINLGTHGFYPFPRVIKNQYNTFIEYMAVTNTPKCYPGMIHVYLVDVLNLGINLLWLKIVIAYVGALHKNNPEPMRMFFSLAVVKVLMQILYLGAQPEFTNIIDFELYWFLKISDIVIAIFLLLIVKKYSNYLKVELEGETVVPEKPPSYIECLVNQERNKVIENKSIGENNALNEKVQLQNLCVV